MTKPTPAKSPFSITLLRAKIRAHDEKIRVAKRVHREAQRAYQALPEDKKDSINHDGADSHGRLSHLRFQVHEMQRLVLWYKNDRRLGKPCRVDTRYANEIIKACAPNAIAQLAALGDKIK